MSLEIAMARWIPPLGGGGNVGRVLITGATGYIGSHLSRSLLDDGHEVYALVRSPVHGEYIEDLEGRIKLLPYNGSYQSVLAAVKTARPELVYHLAAHYKGAPGEVEISRLVGANIVFGAYLLEAMAVCGVTALVYASTVTTHFRGEGYSPLSLYAATKQAFSDLLVYYTDAGLLRAVTLDLADTYGPGDHRAKILNLAWRAAQAGETLLLSDGGQEYDVVYIDDVVRAFRQAGWLILTQPWKNERFQLSSGSPRSLRETVELMLKVNNLSLNAVWGGRAALEREMREVKRIYPELPGWQPQVSLHEGLRRLGI